MSELMVDLDGFPGAPFEEGVLAAAEEQIRIECGWHIAPQIEETLRVYAEGGETVLALPTLKIDEVTEVRDADGETVDGWEQSTAGMLTRAKGWPAGVLEVDLTHGYEQCPAELKPIIAARAAAMSRDMTVRQEGLGNRSATFGIVPGLPFRSILTRYTVE